MTTSPGPRARAQLFERATASLPGGSTRTTVYTAPYPPYVAVGQGLRVRDVDGNEYRDFLGNYTSLILGHAHPAVVAAVEAQVRRGSAFAAPTETEVELAEEIRRRVPSIERLRFTSSGTEATMFAIRAARAHTGRPLIAKFERAYHGTHDAVMAGTAGVPAVMDGLVVELPWGDPDGVEAALRGREADLAAILIEPVQGAGGVRAAGTEFLAFLRDLADRTGALLIFDEIISFRVAPGGAQERFGVRPDLTTLGKIIGGGYPLAAFGGRADVMSVFDARRSGAISHGGTFNGSPVAAAAGLATLRELTPRRTAASTTSGSGFGPGSRPPSSATAWTRASPLSVRSSRSSRARARAGGHADRLRHRRQPPDRASTSPCSSMGSASPRAGWARSRPSPPTRTSTTSRTRSVGRWSRSA